MSAKYNYYALARGLHPETKELMTNMLFETWNEIKPYVIGIENARYKGFLSEEEATIWLNKVATEDMVAPQAKTVVHNDELNTICSELGISRQQLIKHLEDKFIAEYEYFKKIGERK